MAKSGGSSSVSAIERSKRQLSALNEELRLLDRRVLVREPDGGADRASDLQRALDSALLQLGAFLDRPFLDQQLAARSLSAIDTALRDSRYEAEVMIGARRRTA